MADEELHRIIVPTKLKTMFGAEPLIVENLDVSEELAKDVANGKIKTAEEFWQRFSADPIARRVC